MSSSPPVRDRSQCMPWVNLNPGPMLLRLTRLSCPPISSPSAFPLKKKCRISSSISISWTWRWLRQSRGASSRSDCIYLHKKHHFLVFSNHSPTHSATPNPAPWPSNASSKLGNNPNATTPKWRDALLQVQTSTETTCLNCSRRPTINKWPKSSLLIPAPGLASFRRENSTKASINS